MEDDFSDVRFVGGQHVKSAEAVGAGLVEVEELYGIRRKEILEKSMAPLNNLRQWTEDLQFSDLSCQ